MTDTSTSTMITPVDELRQAIRDNKAGPLECIEFVKTLDIERKTGGEVPAALATIKSVRDELPFDDAVTFLESCLNCLNEAFCVANPLFVIAVRFMVAEDQWEQRNYEAAKDEYQKVLEWEKEHPCPLAKAFAFIKLTSTASDTSATSELEALQILHTEVQNFSVLSSDHDSISDWIVCLAEISVKFLMEVVPFACRILHMDLAKLTYSLAKSMASDFGLVEYSHLISTSLYQLDIVSSSDQNFSTTHKDEAEIVLTSFLRSPSTKAVDMKILLKSVLRLEVTHQLVQKLVPSSTMCYENIRDRINDEVYDLLLRYELDPAFKEKIQETTCLLLSISIDDLTSGGDALVKLREVILHHCYFSKVCVLACYYELAEEHLHKAEELVQLCEDGDDQDYAEMRSTIHYAFAVLYYMWKGRMAQTFEHCMLARKCFRDLKNFRNAALMERVLKHMQIQ